MGSFQAFSPPDNATSMNTTYASSPSQSMSASTAAASSPSMLSSTSSSNDAAAAASAQGQLLASAFVFGILLQTAVSALGLWVKGHRKELLRDQRRLVLTIFGIATLLWTQISFVQTQLPPFTLPACQVLLVFSTLLDQLARVAIEAFLFWSVAHSKSKIERIAYAGILGIRIILGGVYVGFTRPIFSPSCTPISKDLPIAVIVLIFDTLIVLSLLVRAFTSGLMAGLKHPDADQKSHNKAIFLGIVGFAIWSATSVPEILRIPSLPFALKNAVPATGWQILIVILTSFPKTLFLPKQEARRIPEASSPSPFNDSPRPILRVGTDDSGSPIVGNDYRDRNLFVVNPSSAISSSNDSPIIQNRGFEKGGANLVNTTAAAPPDYQAGPSTALARSVVPTRDSNDIFAQNMTGSNGLLDPMAMSRGMSKGPDTLRNLKQKKGIFGLGGSSSTGTSKYTISAPIMAPTDPAAAPFTRIPTVDLQTAARNEARRREDADRARELIASRPPPPISTMESLEAGLMNSTSVKRKAPEEIGNGLRQTLTVPSTGSTTSAALSPGREDLRRRSPRDLKSFDEEKMSLTRAASPMAELPLTPLSQIVAPKEEQTVMLINNIEYDNPTFVASVMKSAPLQAISPLRIMTPIKSPTRPLKHFRKDTADSIIHRPRPIKRDEETDRPFFPAEPSPYRQHQRGKSTPSFALRKSLAAFAARGASEMPTASRAPPTTAAALKKLLPTEGEEMTAEEKIQILFPAPPSPKSVSKRRSSVPSIPVSRAISLSSPTLGRMAFDDAISRRTSKRTTVATFTETPTTAPGRADDMFSAGQYEQLMNNIDDSWFEDQYSAVFDEEPLSRGGIADDSPVIPSSPPIRSNLRLPLKASVLNSMKPSVVNIPKPSTADRTPTTGPTSANAEIMTIMLDTASVAPTPPSSDKPTHSRNGSTDSWHRRIGDEMLTFSENRRTLNPKAMPPPAPLLLGVNGKSRAAVEASPLVMESPTQAMLQLQAQLEKFEQPKSAGIQSILERLPAGEEVSENRNSLLDRLELEMGQQEDQWQNVRHNFDRNSTSTFRSSIPGLSVTLDESRRQSMVSVQESISQRLSTLSAILADKDMSRASMWQRRLAAAEMEYLEQALATGTADNEDFLSLAKAQLGSPTPPESIAGSDLRFEIEEERERRAFMAKLERSTVIVNTLWVSPLPLPPRPSDMLWAAPAAINKEIEPTMPAKSLRPSQHRSTGELYIESSNLWSKSSETILPSTQGLWGSDIKEKPARPPTLRPPRKTRRMTILADILESPEPLPNKRETLGIFQFPWGEKSDSAVYQPTYPAASAMLLMNSGVQGVQEEADYSSSFFDDYDEELEDDPAFEPESDDEFDESTLNEIATMLQTSEVPSRGSMFPSESRLLEDFEDETEEESDEPAMFTMKLPIPPLAASVRTTVAPSEPPKKFPVRQSLGLGQATMSSRRTVASPERVPVAIPRPSALWEHREEMFETTSDSLFTAGSSRKDFRTTDAVPIPITMNRTPRASIAELPTLSSKQMWSTSEKTEVTAKRSSALWETTDVGAVISTDVEVGFAAPEHTTEVEHIVAREQAIALEPTSTAVFEEPAILEPGVPEASREFTVPTPNAETPLEQVVTESVLDMTSEEEISKKTLTITPEETTLLEPASALVPIEIPTEIPTSDAPEPFLVASVDIEQPRQSLMWTAKQQEIEDNNEGLFSAKSRRASFRKTDKPVVAVDMSVHRRPTPSMLEELTSSNMWTASQKQTSITDWMRETARAAPPPRTLLWDPAPSKPRFENEGLFSLHGRCEFRNTSSPVIGQSMQPARRQCHHELAQLQSRSMWVRPKRSADIDDRHWLFDTCEFALSPTVYSPSSSGNSSPASIMSNATSVSTAASSIFSIQMDGRPSSRIPVAVEKKPVPPPKAQRSPPMPPVLEDARRSPRDASARPQLKSINTSLPVSRPVFMTKSYPHRNVKPADWDEALASAISAGQPNPGPSTLQRRLERPRSTAAEWEAALNEALQAENDNRIVYDVAVRHPVYFTASRTTTALEIHPAAVGFMQLTNAPSRWSFTVAPVVAVQRPTVEKISVAAVHPVFMGSMTTSALEVHPAALGYAQPAGKPVDAMNDVAVRHPVFMGSMTTTALEVHPAALGHVEKDVEGFF